MAFKGQKRIQMVKKVATIRLIFHDFTGPKSDSMAFQDLYAPCNYWRTFVIRTCHGWFYAASIIVCRRTSSDCCNDCCFEL